MSTKNLVALSLVLAAFGCGVAKEDDYYTPTVVPDCGDAEGTISRVEQCGRSEEEYAPVLCSRPDSSPVVGCAVHLVNGRTAQPWTMACVEACAR